MKTLTNLATEESAQTFLLNPKLSLLETMAEFIDDTTEESVILILKLIWYLARHESNRVRLCDSKIGMIPKIIKAMLSSENKDLRLNALKSFVNLALEETNKSFLGSRQVPIRS
jgi:hypothetical protein